MVEDVHVGGIVVSDDAGATWAPTSIDVRSDAHEVMALGDYVLAATGRLGLCVSRDRGQTWAAHGEGLPLAHEEFAMKNDHYCRAVAVAGDTVLLSASTGAFTERAGLFRRPLSSERPFAQCTVGLRPSFPDNIDTGCVAAEGSMAAFGTSTGEIHARATGLPPSWASSSSDPCRPMRATQVDQGRPSAETADVRCTQMHPTAPENEDEAPTEGL